MTEAMIEPTPRLTVSRCRVEDFLYMEARLLDRWLLKEWLALFAEYGRYLIAPAGAADDANPLTTLFYVNDDHFLLSERVRRLYKRNAHAEFPHSKCRRMVSNVELLGGADDAFQVATNFIVFRTKSGKTDIYPGHCLYKMSLYGERIVIQEKALFLDLDDLYEQAKVSIVL